MNRRTDISTARRLTTLHLERSTYQDQVLVELQRDASGNDFEEARRIVGKTLGAL